MNLKLLPVPICEYWVTLKSLATFNQLFLVKEISKFKPALVGLKVNFASQLAGSSGVGYRQKYLFNVPFKFYFACLK